jgi:hypothetical protein
VKKKREKKKPLPLAIDDITAVPGVPSIGETRVKKRGRRLSSSSG